MATRPRWYSCPAVRTGSWTEDAFLGLDDRRGAELVDGALIVTPRGSTPHQRIATRLLRVLEDAAPVGVEVLAGVSVRLRRGRILVPDLVVLSRSGLEAEVLDAADVGLVCEISTPSDAGTDRFLKVSLYAQARIPRYLLIEVDERLRVTATVFELDPEGNYGPDDAATMHGRIMTMDAPFRVSVDLARLARTTGPARRPHSTRPRTTSRGAGSPRLRRVRIPEDPE